MLDGDPAGPVLKLMSGPFESMIGMPELTSGQRLPHHVVLTVRSRHNDGLRSGELEYDPLQGGQSRRVEMLEGRLVPDGGQS